ARIHDRHLRQPVGVDVVAAAAEVVVGVPGDVAGDDGDGGAGRGRRDDPGEGELQPRRRGGGEIVEAAARRGGDVLLVRGADVADAVPGDAGLRVVAVGRDLHGGAGAVLVVPAESADELLVPAVAPQGELVLLDGVDAELALLAGPDTLRPGV